MTDRRDPAARAGNLQTMGDDQRATSEPTPFGSAGTGSLGSAPAPTVRRDGPKPIVAGTLSVGFAIVGLVAGGLLGARAPQQYQTSMAVEVGQVLSFDPWEANLQTARFGQAILRPDLQTRAAELVGLERSHFLDIASEQAPNSPIVQVQVVVDDPSNAPQALQTLVDETLRDLVDSDIAPEQLVVDRLGPELANAEADRATIWNETGEPPGTSVVDAYSQAVFDLETATAELEVATEAWRRDQLPGIIAAEQARIDRLEPVLDRWYEVTTRITDLEAQVTPAEERIRALELGREVLDTGTHRSDAVVTELSRSSNTARWAAGGAAVGLAVALAVIGMISLLGSRRR